MRSVVLEQDDETSPVVMPVVLLFLVAQLVLILPLPPRIVFVAWPPPDAATTAVGYI